MQENNSSLITSVSMDDISFLIQWRSAQEQLTVLENYFWFTYTISNSHSEVIRIMNSDNKHGVFVIDKGFVKFPQKHDTNPFFVDEISGTTIGVIWIWWVETIRALHVKIDDYIYSWILAEGNMFQSITLGDRWEIPTFTSYREAHEWVKTFVEMQQRKEHIDDILSFHKTETWPASTH